MADPKEHFYRHFQGEVTRVQEEIENLATLSSIGGERQDGINSVLGNISRLSKEVMDAGDYIPVYDQRTYSQAIKALTQKLNETTGSFAPKKRFQFKKAAPSPSSSNTSDEVANPVSMSRRVVSSDGGNDSDQDTLNPLPSFPNTHTFTAGKDYNEELSQSTSPRIRKPSFSTAKNIVITSHTSLHIILPSSASHATSSGSLTDLTRCIVDMTVPTHLDSGTPFAGLALKDIADSLLVCGAVSGAVHVTGLTNCVVVVKARQVRIHECKDVRIYLWCASHPIIEDCEGVGFAPLPVFYADDTSPSEMNQWDKVDDFKWLKAEASPNWRVVPEDERLKDGVWRDKVCGGPSLGTDDILKEVGVLKS
ncbi:tubulin binding cofactor C-domain-containing protein [Xylariaceae sp. FL1272]|nr:tubulin binding cofactor C-domain-containing protein [Xylariaceae sp. FL1272]